MNQETIEVDKKALHNLKSSLSAVLGYIQLAQKKLSVETIEDNLRVLELLDKAKLSALSLENQIINIESAKAKENSN